MRQAINILALPYKILDKKIYYAVFKRSDANIFQGLAGGVEANESNLEAAKRECNEEANISYECDYIALDASASIPANVFPEHIHWKDTYVVKEISFGVNVHDDTLKLSYEHTSFVWCLYEEAYDLLTFDSNKVALYELNLRLLKSILEKK